LSILSNYMSSTLNKYSASKKFTTDCPITRGMILDFQILFEMVNHMSTEYGFVTKLSNELGDIVSAAHKMEPQKDSSLGEF